MLELLHQVGLPAPETRLRDYPHQFSGGMLQRTVIAIALAQRPDLIVADEPTTALDVLIQDQILALLLSLQRDLGTSLILVSHDLSVVSQVCDRVAVMYAGQVVELADTATLLESPRHPYTRALLEALPGAVPRDQELRVIPGSPAAARRSRRRPAASPPAASCTSRPATTGGPSCATSARPTRAGADGRPPKQLPSPSPHHQETQT